MLPIIQANNYLVPYLIVDITNPPKFIKWEDFCMQRNNNHDTLPNYLTKQIVLDNN